MSKKEISVLCIEDDNPTRQSLVRTLSHKYENIFGSANGLEAIDVIQNNDVDVIVTDIRMPKMDGIALLEYLKENKIKTPVIILSAYDNTDYLHKAIEFKVEKYLNKPIDLNTLVDSIDSIDLKEKATIDSSMAKNIISDISLTVLELKLQKDLGYIEMNKLYESIDTIESNIENLNKSIALPKNDLNE
ncbi:MAG: response regulator [Sulfurovum sp.]